MTLIINPKYERLRDYLVNIADHFEDTGRTLPMVNNGIRLLDVDGLTLCVKHYDRTSWRNRLAVRIYKASKGQHSYNCAAQLRERGFATQEPVAYVAYRRNLMDQNMYFVGIFSNYQHSLHEAFGMPHSERAELLESFAHYAARLHEEGFLPIACRADNILFDRIDGRYRFSILDTGNMKCGRKVSVEKGCKSLAALQADEAFNSALIRAYAAARGADEAECQKYFERAKS